MPIPSVIIEKEPKANSQQEFRETEVTINLVDCIQCFVKISRCQVKLK